MDTLFVPTEHTVTIAEGKSTDNSNIVMHKNQKEDVSYEHEGYQVRVHFKGDKTLIQCIRNLTERRI